MADKKSFILFNDLKEPVNNLSDVDAGKLFKAIFEYQNGGMTQDLPASAEMAFLFIKQQLDRSTEWYESICERNRINGLKGGRPKNPEKPKEPSGLFGNPPKPKLTLPDPDPDPHPDPDLDKEKKKKHKYGEYSHVLLTDTEYQKIQTKTGNADKWIKILDEGIELKGYKYRSHYLAVLKWYKKDEPVSPKKKIYPVCAACGASMKNPIINNFSECYNCGEKHERKVLMMKMKELNV